MNTEHDPFAGKQGAQSDWEIEATPTQVGQKWRANSHAMRAPSEEGDDQGDSLTFEDLGDYDTKTEAIDRAISWTAHWIEANN